jgi:hypothetical protein
MIVYLLAGYYTHMHVHMCVNIYVIYKYCILLYHDIIVSYHTISILVRIRGEGLDPPLRSYKPLGPNPQCLQEAFTCKNVGTTKT